MKHPIHSPEELGLIVRAVRKSAGVRQDDMAALAQLSKQFAADVEHGKPTAQIGRVLRLLNNLGLKLSVHVPESAEPLLRQLKAQCDEPAGVAQVIRKLPGA